MTLQFFGFMISQPTRAVGWLLKAKGLEYEFVLVNPHHGDANNADFLAMDPNGLVPVIKDGDFSLFEG